MAIDSSSGAESTPHIPAFSDETETFRRTMSTRKRKDTQSKQSHASAMSVATPTASSEGAVASSAPTRRKQPPRPTAARQYGVQRATRSTTLLVASASYFRSVLAKTLWLLQWPLVFLTTLMVVAMMIVFITNKSRSVLAASPLCSLPGISSSPFCQRHSTAPPKPKGSNNADFVELIELQGGFKEIMKLNAGADNIGFKLKQSEMATRDLVTLVRVSELSSREVLAEALNQFVYDAKKAGEGLHRLSAKVNGAVDHITIVNDYALRMIEAAVDRRNPALPQAGSSFVSHATIPFTPNSRVDETSEAAILRSFDDVMHTLARETERTLIEAAVSATGLEQLQERLITIHEICSREGVTLGEAHAELLSELWSRLGGNHHAKRKHEMQFAVLKAVDQYRKEALVHVIVTRDVLQGIAADVEELRERTAAPVIVGERVSPEVLIRCIRNGIERLQEGRRVAGRRRQMLVEELLAVSGGVGSIEDY